MFEIFITRKIHASMEFTFDWWTDLSPDDPNLVKPLKSRRIISRTPTVVRLEDEEDMYFRRMKFQVEVFLERPKKWRAIYEGKVARATSEYVLNSEIDGTTTMKYHSMIEPKGFLTNLFSPIVKFFVRRIFEGEMDIFNRTLEAEFREKAPGKPSNS
jgi:hypothetical protein